MLLPKFDFHEPTSVDEACEILATFGPKAKVLAGGTDLMVNLKKKILAPENLVCLSRIDSLHGIVEEKDQIVIGGRYTVAELTVDPLVEKKLGALRSGARALGSPLVRNRATIAGNIGSARPAADLPPSLIAYGATVILVSSQGKREVPLGDFFKGPGFTELRPEEVLTEVRVPVPTAGQAPATSTWACARPRIATWSMWPPILPWTRRTGPSKPHGLSWGRWARHPCGPAGPKRHWLVRSRTRRSFSRPEKRPARTASPLMTSGAQPAIARPWWGF